jgi:hypothetical protein
MKLFKWIAVNKIVIVLPLLALIAVSVFVFAQNRVQARNSNPAAAESSPPPIAKTADGLQKLKLLQLHPKLFFRSTICPVPAVLPPSNRVWPAMRAFRISSSILPVA